MHAISFVPGPSSLYYTVPDHIKMAVQSGILQSSHRSPMFKSMYEQTVTALRNLMSIPENFDIVFTASATEVWERSLQNLAIESSLHLVNGAFSKRYYEFAKTMGYQALKAEVAHGSCVSPSSLPKTANPEIVAITLNESSTGAMHTLEEISDIRSMYPEALVGIDGVSSVPYNDLDYSKFDFLYLSVQKCFGLPAGLGLWIVNDRCLKKHFALKQKGIWTGTTRDLETLVNKSREFQTIETPNVLNIYLLGKVCEDMLLKGLDQIRREINYKATLLYHTAKKYDFLNPFVSNPSWRSKTVIVFKSEKSLELIKFFEEKKMIIAGGYGQFKNEHIRIANFPTHSKEQIELLVDLLETF